MRLLTHRGERILVIRLQHSTSAQRQAEAHDDPHLRGVDTTAYRSDMRKGNASKIRKAQLGQYIVADPAVCHGKPTFKGTRIFVADVLADVERGLSWDFIIHRWGGNKLSRAAITEAVQLARRALLDERGALSSAA